MYLEEAVRNKNIQEIKNILSNHKVAKSLLNESLTESEDPEITILLINHGADIHYSSDRALFRSSLRRNIQNVKILLEFGANVNSLDSRALRIACQYDYIGIVKLLLSFGARINFNILSQVVKSNNIPLLKILLEYRFPNEEIYELRYLTQNPDIIFELELCKNE